MRIFVVLAGLLAASGPVRALDEPTFLSSGTYLTLPMGARPAALGDCFAAIADDAHALDWNPAGLSGASRSLALSAQKLLVDQRVGHVALSWPFRSWGSGVSLSYSDYGIFDRRRSTGEISSALTFQASSLTFAAGLARRVYGRSADSTRGVHVGLAVRFLSETLADDVLATASVDFGALWNLGPMLRLAVVARNLGAPVYGFALQDHFVAAVASTLWKDRVTLTLEGDGSSTDWPAMRLGVEFRPLPAAALRLGLRQRVNAHPLDEASGITAGFGVAGGPVGLDYAFAGHGRLGNMHRVTLRYSFAALARERHATVAPVDPKPSTETSSAETQVTTATAAPTAEASPKEAVGGGDKKLKEASGAAPKGKAATPAAAKPPVRPRLGRAAATPTPAAVGVLPALAPSPSAAAEAEGPRFCPKCGNGLTGGPAFCPKCGNDLRPAARP